MILHLDCVPMKPDEHNTAMLVAETPEEFLVVLRQHRNVMLAQTDWRVMPDSPMSEEERQEWIEYRAYLRGLTDSVVQPLGASVEIQDPPTSGGPIRVAQPGELNR